MKEILRLRTKLHPKYVGKDIETKKFEKEVN